MTLSELLILLPCHSLEDFPVHHEGDEAQGLLANWTALWHPRLIAAADSAPGWGQIDDPPSEHEGRLILIPGVSEGRLPVGWVDRAREDGALVIENGLDRDAILAEALAQLDGPAVDDAIVAEFLALGFCYLQVELLTRQMRYTSHVDEDYFHRQTVEAAHAAVAGDASKTDEKLAACYDMLAEARNQFYPVDSYLVDLTLLAPTTLGPALRDQLARHTAELPTNLLVTAEVIEQMAAEEPETLAALRNALERGAACIVGGEYCEGDLSLLPCEQTLASFDRGREVYQQHLGTAPIIFGRRRFGLAPFLPQILQKLGFQGALHLSLDGGRFPQADQNKIRWEGADGSTVDALSRPPYDATQADSYLNFAQRLGDSMDHEHVATMTFARWPGHAPCWLDDLQRGAARGPALGRFVRLDDYFASTETPDLHTRFEADEYLSPLLSQRVAAGLDDPISGYVAAYEQSAAESASASLTVMADAVDPEGDAGEPDSSQRIVDAVGPGPSTGRLLLNPASFDRRIAVDLTGLDGAPPAERHVRATGLRGDVPQAVVDVPSMGFGYVGGSATPVAPDLPLAEEHTLRNEHFEIAVNPATGGIASVHHYNRRGNLLSQQIAYRAPGYVGDDPDRYSVMAADEIDITASTEAMGEIVSRGRLVDRHGEQLARYEQTLRLWRGSRVLDVQIALEPNAATGADPWESYYASRLAWDDSAADVWRGVGGSIHPSVIKRVEAPGLISIRAAKGVRLAVLSRGLPFHRRTGLRMLDTMLIVKGETARRFRFGIGVDLTHPSQAAWEQLLDTQSVCFPAGPPNGPASGWLFHLSAKNVTATHWESIRRDGRPVGFRLRVLETEGRSGQVAISATRPIVAARHTDYLGQTLGDLPIDDGKAMLSITSHEWAQIEAEW
jgi:alpha-mannosidase